MQLPGLLIEYLINGSSALLWIWSLYMVLKKPLPSIEDKYLLVFLPGLYVLGMIIDYVATLTAKALKDRIEDPYESRLVRLLWMLVLKRRKKIKKNYYARRLLKHLTHWMWAKKKTEAAKKKEASLAEIMYRSKELGQEYIVRSSRDRIARGAFVNAVITTIILSIFCPCSSPYLPLYFTLPIGMAISILCFAMYYRFNRLTSRYKRNASNAIRKQYTS